MKKTLYLVAVIILFASPAFAQTPDMLMKREQAMLTAVEKKDWTAFNQLTLPTGWNVDENGAMSVADFLKMTADPKFDLNVKMTASDMKVMDVNATTKIVTYKLDQKGTFMGTPFPPTVYASTVWVNQGGTWKAAFHQESKAAPPAPKK
jgi:hypothetical protein